MKITRILQQNCRLPRTDGKRTGNLHVRRSRRELDDFREEEETAQTGETGDRSICALAGFTGTAEALSGAGGTAESVRKQKSRPVKTE